MLTRFNALSFALFGMLAAMVPGLASAAPLDLTTLTAELDWSKVWTGLLAVGVSLITVYIAWKGVKMVINAVRSL